MERKKNAEKGRRKRLESFKNGGWKEQEERRLRIEVQDGKRGGKECRERRESRKKLRGN